MLFELKQSLQRWIYCLYLQFMFQIDYSDLLRKVFLNSSNLGNNIKRRIDMGFIDAI